MKNELSYEGYTLKWCDEFDGAELNREDWNVELHDPGWVNAEWQAYVDSEKNIYLENGKLIIKPIKTVNEDGTVSYTSGRISTQNKRDFTYGIFEARLKVPKGKGYLPAFWLMATDESNYGQWPRSGEIDIMEILGDNVATEHGTIHYGNPHNQSQGVYKLENTDFAEDFHTFAVEWEPGRISWYVDGQLFHTESDWYSATEGLGTITYPAPFDHPFFVILNLAVGGSWVGYPDETTDFENTIYEVDYVRVYQKDSYNEDVSLNRGDCKETIEDNEKTMRSDGNYVYNGFFQEGEKRLGYWHIENIAGAEVSVTNLSDGRRLKVVAPQETSAENSVVISQGHLALTGGKEYLLSFEVEGEVGTKVAVQVAGEALTTVELTGEKLTSNSKFTLTSDAVDKNIVFIIDKSGTYYLDNIRIAEATLIKNENFSAGLLGYEIYVDDAASASYVVDSLTEDNAMEFTINNTGEQSWTIQLTQSDIELEQGQWYRLSVTAKSSLDRQLMLAIQKNGTLQEELLYFGEKTIELTGEYQTYTSEFQMVQKTDSQSLLRVSAGAVDGKQITTQHRICIDSIKLEKIDTPTIEH